MKRLLKDWGWAIPQLVWCIVIVVLWFLARLYCAWAQPALPLPAAPVEDTNEPVNPLSGSAQLHWRWQQLSSNEIPLAGFVISTNGKPLTIATATATNLNYWPANVQFITNTIAAFGTNGTQTLTSAASVVVWTNEFYQKPETNISIIYMRWDTNVPPKTLMATAGRTYTNWPKIYLTNFGTGITTNRNGNFWLVISNWSE